MELKRPANLVLVLAKKTVLETEHTGTIELESSSYKLTPHGIKLAKIKPTNTPIAIARGVGMRLTCAMTEFSRLCIGGMANNASTTEPRE